MEDLDSLMRQAQGMQAKLQEAQSRLGETVLEGVAGAGLVRVSLKGDGEMTALSIAPSLFAEGDAETLCDLIRAAHAQARAALAEASARLMQEAMGPLAGLAGGLPGFKV